MLARGCCVRAEQGPLSHRARAWKTLPPPLPSFAEPRRCLGSHVYAITRTRAQTQARFHAHAESRASGAIVRMSGGGKVWLYARVYLRTGRLVITLPHPMPARPKAFARLRPFAGGKPRRKRA